MIIWPTIRRAAARIPFTVRIAVAFLATGVLVGLALAHVADSVTAKYQPAGRVLISADGRTLSGTIGGRCGTGTLEVAEAPSTVTVRLRLYPSFMVAPGSCAIETFTAHLRAPLGRRRLIDGVTGEALPAFDGRGILRPAVLPPDFVHRYDTASLPDEGISGGRAGCIQLYTNENGYDNGLVIAQNIDATWTPPDGVVATPITVRGVAGAAIPGEISSGPRTASCSRSSRRRTRTPC